MPNDDLIRDYTLNFMGKVYYFCLKRTGSPSLAEELAQDISLRIISSLSNCARPENFPAYVWRTARNCHADFAEKRRRTRERFGADVYEIEFEDDTPGPEEQLIRSEQLKLLRRELAFISEDYRKIVVAFYIEDRSVKDISASLNLPENTVKSKLYRARKFLKEGIDMAREFGPKSYKPENISFVANGNQPSGLPWKAVETMFAKNVLLEASNNPSTVEELAVALGIAVPYMQEQVDALVSATLLRALDGKKYVTDFPIVSAGKRVETVEIVKSSAPKAAEYADEIAEDIVKKIKDMGLAGSLDAGGLKWLGVFRALHMMEFCTESPASGGSKPKARANGETWEFYGFEEGADNPDHNFVSCNGVGCDGGQITLFFFHKYNLGGDFEIKMTDAKRAVWVMKTVREGKKYRDLTDHEKTVIDSFPALVRVEPDGRLVSNVLLLSTKEDEEIEKLIKNHPSFKPLCKIHCENAEKILQLLRSENSETVRKDLPGVVGTMNHIRGFVADEELAKGRLTLPENPAKSLATAYAVLR